MSLPAPPRPQQHTPCMDSPDLWHMPRAKDQKYAARICREECPAAEFARCRAYIEAVPGEWGVWAASTEKDRENWVRKVAS